MAQPFFVARRTALVLWAALLLLFLLLGLWNVHSVRREGLARLNSAAGRTAAQLSALLSLPAWEMDELAARAIVMSAMEDDGIYAVKVQSARGMLEGQRRNSQWEPVPWDDELEEDSARGAHPLHMEGSPVGSVEVWLSSRPVREELALTARRELWRFALTALTCSAALLLWWRQRAGAAGSSVAPFPPPEPEEWPVGHSENGMPLPYAAEAAESEDARPGLVVSEFLGRSFQHRHPEAWNVTAGLFRQSFADGAALLRRLSAEGDVAGLCRLGRLLEKAAPCLGAERLAAAARDMQTALNDPACAAPALAVERCAGALEEALAALA